MPSRLLRLVRSSPANEVELYFRPTPARPRDLEWVSVARRTDGQSTIVERAPEELDRLAKEGRVFQFEAARRVGATRDLPRGFAMVTDREFQGHTISTLGYGLNCHEFKGEGLAQFTIGVALGTRLTCFDEPLLAVTSVTTPLAFEAERSLMRLSARYLPEEAAERRHPALGEFHRFATRFAAESGVRLWLYSEEVIRALLQPIYFASGPDGFLWEGQSRKFRIRVEGDLVNPAARELVRDLAFGLRPLDMIKIK